MKIRLLLPVFLLAFYYGEAQSIDKNTHKFNDGWLFQKAVQGRAQSEDFPDKNWRQLNLPHDWAIEGPFDSIHDTRTGGLPISGTAWYRKHFVIDAKHKGRKVIVEFDGVMNNSTVWINGHKVGGRPYGYIGFEVDLTSHIKFGEENIIAVKVNPEDLAARWYPGAGIYRNVWLKIKNPVHVAHRGTYITTPKITENKAEINIQTILNNTTNSPGEFELKTSIINTHGAEVVSNFSKIELSANTSVEVAQDMVMDNPIKWDLDNPYLYTAISFLKKNGKVIDTYSTDFGVRSIEYSNTEGFLLNGKQLKFKGVCMHHDLGPLGAAVNYRATQRQLELLKSMGVNAIRTAHNPPSPEQLDLCDRMGILVQVEAFDGWAAPKTKNDYSKHWDKWFQTDLRDMIKRDRNHPSVVMWSIGNEVKEQTSPKGGELAKILTGICHEMDPTRPVTAGLSKHLQAIKNGLADPLDIQGFNYKPTQYDEILEEHPDWIIYGSETSSCVSSRGIYHLPVENYEKHPSLQISSYDIISPPWAYPPDFEVYAQEMNPRSLGQFVWTGFDYLGEPTPFNGRDNETHGKWGGDWPSRSSYFGMLDLAGFKKDRFYFYQSIWTDEPMVHILPHWNWDVEKNTTIPVYCYTNCEEAELFLNGESLGKKKMGVDKTTIPADFKWWKQPEKTWDSPYRLNWEVPYQPGKLKVVAYSNGKVKATKSIITAGKPAQIKLSPDRSFIDADGEDLSFIKVQIEDKNGNFCPTADNLVEFEVSGPAIIEAVGNGDPTSITSFQADNRRAFNGLCLLVIRSKKDMAGEIKVTAKSNGLNLASVEIISE
ncbi:beta-galactosidase GalB [Christiangramia crocea]|uniref:DUF4982 domain-containing protein n=1 Tax=Christiangramia crocea TaxID=2904124 RepID=A0A9X1UZN4_9FLAO|nr:beta-galactosidase GalB [Gramella crocea]MCG9972544.1 DUF4982 domain-containing protein [Gramella crocea]